MLFHHVVREETGRVDRLSQVRLRLVSSVWQLLQPVQLDHTINTYIGGKHFNLCWYWRINTSLMSYFGIKVMQNIVDQKASAWGKFYLTSWWMYLKWFIVSGCMASHMLWFSRYSILRSGKFRFSREVDAQSVNLREQSPAQPWRTVWASASDMRKYMKCVRKLSIKKTKKLGRRTRE